MHLVNEAALITLCIFLIQSTPGVYPDFTTGYVLESGYLVIVFISAFILFNLVAIVYDLVYKWCRLHWVRRGNIVDFRSKFRHHSKLINQRNLMMASRLEEMLREEKENGGRKNHDKKLKTLEVKFKRQVVVDSDAQQVANQAPDDEEKVES